MRMIDPESISQDRLNNKYTPAPFVSGKVTCSLCGRPILKEQLPKNPRDAQYVMKWKVHHECRNQVANVLDRVADPGRKKR